jgi:hypothetical protein
MTRSVIKLANDEQDTLKSFYNRLREALIKGYGYGEEEADFEAYKWILKETSKPPKDYFKILACIPQEAQDNIIKHLGYSNFRDFKKNFSKQLNIYRQGSLRRDEKGENDDFKN